MWILTFPLCVQQSIDFPVYATESIFSLSAYICTYYSRGEWRGLVVSACTYYSSMDVIAGPRLFIQNFTIIQHQAGFNPPRQREVCYQTTCSNSKPQQLDNRKKSKIYQNFSHPLIVWLSLEFFPPFHSLPILF